MCGLINFSAGDVPVRRQHVPNCDPPSTLLPRVDRRVQDRGDQPTRVQTHGTKGPPPFLRLPTSPAPLRHQRYRSNATPSSNLRRRWRPFGPLQTSWPRHTPPRRPCKPRHHRHPARLARTQAALMRRERSPVVFFGCRPTPFSKQLTHEVTAGEIASYCSLELFACHQDHAIRGLEEHHGRALFKARPDSEIGRHHKAASISHYGLIRPTHVSTIPHEF